MLNVAKTWLSKPKKEVKFERNYDIMYYLFCIWKRKIEV